MGLLEGEEEGGEGGGREFGVELEEVGPEGGETFLVVVGDNFTHLPTRQLTHPKQLPRHLLQKSLRIIHNLR